MDNVLLHRQLREKKFVTTQTIVIPLRQTTYRVRLVVGMESEELESERVKMESRGKLSNDEKIMFVGPIKV